MNIWNTVIRTNLESLSANSNIYANTGMNVIDFFSSLWVLFFCFFAHLAIFDLMPAIVNFIFLGSWNFCIPIIIELCSEMQLHYLEAVQSFQIVLLWCVWQVWNSVQSGENYSLLLRQELSEYCTQHHIIMTFPNLVGDNTLSWYSVNIRHCFLWFHVMVLSPASSDSFTCMLWSINY